MTEHVHHLGGSTQSTGASPYESGMFHSLVIRAVANTLCRDTLDVLLLRIADTTFKGIHHLILEIGLVVVNA